MRSAHLLCVAFVAAVVAIAASAHAANPNDIQISIGDPLGSSPSSYGYATIPFAIENTSDRDRTVRMVCAGESGWSMLPSFVRVSRSFVVPANAVLEGSFLRPPARLPNSPTQVWVDGTRRRNDVLLGDGRFSDTSGWGYSTSGMAESILVGRRVPMGITDTLTLTAKSTSGAYSGGGYRTPGSTSIDVVTVDASWPIEWLAYSRFRMIALAEDEWHALSGAAKSAILEAVSAGLHLWIASAADPAKFAGPFTVEPEMIDESEQRANLSPGEKYDANNTSRSGVIGMGRVVAVDPTRTLPSWLLNQVFRSDTTGWHTTLTDDDGERSLPLKQSHKVPAGKLVFLLAVFALLIGPVNTLVMVRMNRRVLLFVTTPVLGLLFSAGVFAYGLMHDGTQARAISRAVTVLDAGSGFATTFAHTAYYAPFAPRDGLRFDSRTMVIPSLTSGSDGYRQNVMTLDLTDGQHFATGLVRPRVPTHVRFMRVEPRRERMVFTRLPDGGVRVQNGLGVDIRALYYADDLGSVYIKRNLSAGVEGTMELVAEGAASPMFEVTRSLALRDPAIALSANGELRDPDMVPIGGFAACIDSSPFHTTGLSTLRKHDAVSLVIGLAELE